MGIANAAVFPVPVWAMARTSSPFNIDGIALNCIFVVLIKPSCDRFLFIADEMWYFSNFTILIYSFKPF
jgi:hypothetical protein